MDLEVSHKYSVLPPKDDSAYPISCSEWDHIKIQISRITEGSWFFQNAGSVFAGASLSAFTAILFGAIPNAADNPSPRIIAWAVSIGSGIVSALCYLFAYLQSKSQKIHGSSIVTFMETVERRYIPNQASDEAVTEDTKPSNEYLSHVDTVDRVVVQSTNPEDPNEFVFEVADRIANAFGISGHRYTPEGLPIVQFPPQPKDVAEKIVLKAIGDDGCGIQYNLS